MNFEKSLHAPLAWIGGGLLGAVLAYFGLAPTGAASKPPAKAPPAPLLSWQHPSVKGSLSLASSMWEDPFIHLDNAHLQGLTEPDSDIKRILTNKIGKRSKVMFLVVSVDGGLAEDQVESRQRVRHAVELALANQGFALPFPNRMTYRPAKLVYHFTERSSPSESTAAEAKKAAPNAPQETDSDDQQDPETVDVSTHLPTKLYRHKDSGDLILLTWIQESHLGRRPLDTFRRIVKPVMPEGKSFADRTAFCLLGPASSNTLNAIVKDCDKLTKNAGQLTEDDQETLQFFKDFELGATICNSVCTATNSSLGLTDHQKSLDLGSDTSIRLIHTIASDSRLLDALQHELTIRGVLPSEESTNEMVLFSEQSSLSYIDDLEDSFFNSSEIARPIVVPYLKDIAASQGSAQASGSASHSLSVQDYLDRSMAEFGSVASSRGINPSRVRAVGIIGSKWEDKNLILQKARQVFPTATFFTTELDARYNLPEVVPYSRNLIVASHYGLLVSGRDDIFGRVNNIPSFRDGYQTSRFIGMSVLGRGFREGKLQADEFTLVFGEQPQNLFDLVGRSGTETSTAPAYLRPLTFEIGNYSAIQLRDRDSPEYLPLRQPPNARSLFSDGPWLGAVLILLAVSIFAVNVLAPFSDDLRSVRSIFKNSATGTIRFMQNFVGGKSSTKEHPALWSVVVAILLVVLVIGTMLARDHSLHSEPILFASGVSLWPSIWGLSLVIMLSLRSIAKSTPKYSEEVGRFIGDEAEPGSAIAFKLAATLTIAFYLVSYLESGAIQPPARDWIVRWLAIFILFAATLCLMIVAFRCLLFSLNARRVISQATRNMPKSLDLDSQQRMVSDCRSTMHLSIIASKKLLRPAVLSIVLIISRWRGWDAWGLDRSWYVLLITPICLSFIAAIIVRLAAIRFRNEVLEKLHLTHYNLMHKQAKSNSVDPTIANNAKMLEESEVEIERLNRGPFGPLSQDYLLGAAVLVFTIAVTGPAGAFLNRVLTFVP